MTRLGKSFVTAFEVASEGSLPGVSSRMRSKVSGLAEGFTATREVADERAFACMRAVVASEISALLERFAAKGESTDVLRDIIADRVVLMMMDLVLLFRYEHSITVRKRANKHLDANTVDCLQDCVV